MEEEKKKLVPGSLDSQGRPLNDPTKPAWYDDEAKKWRNYHPKKGVKPPWDPFNPEHRRHKLTIRERKFLYMLSKTGSLSAAFKASYKSPTVGDPKQLSALINSSANRVLDRLRVKAPELAAAFTFDDITPDFVKKELMKLYADPNSTIHEKTRLLELMGKTQALFTDKIVSDTKIKETIQTVYQEGDDDFPTENGNLSRMEMDDIPKA